jgi:hypothetical protein
MPTSLTPSEVALALTLADEIGQQASQNRAAALEAFDAGFREGFERALRVADEAEDDRWAYVRYRIGKQGMRESWAELERRRHFLACPPCRLRKDGPLRGCPDCEQRTRETWSGPMPGDYLGQGRPRFPPYDPEWKDL